MEFVTDILGAIPGLLRQLRDVLGEEWFHGLLIGAGLVMGTRWAIVPLVKAVRRRANGD